MRRLLCLAIACVMAAPVSAVTLDGSIAGDGYGLVSTQTLQTQFGDANPAGGSELDAAWAQVQGGTLYLTLTGNLENNFNKIAIFIDSVAGGENVITLPFGSGGNNPGNDNWANKYAGFTFDTGFAADYLLINRRGDGAEGSTNGKFDFDFNSVGNTSVVESSSNIFFPNGMSGVNASVGASGIGVAFNNTNVLGVTGGTAAANQADAQAVQTGLELAIPLSAIGNPGPGDCIKISAMVNSGNFDYLSNQFLGGLPTGLMNGGGAGTGTGNLGGDGNGNFNGTVGQINLNNFSGEQYFTICIVPEPTSVALMGLSLLGLACGRGRGK